MKEIDKKEFQRQLERCRVKIGMTYYGKSNSLTVGIKWDDKAMPLGKLTDEQVVILWQLVNSANSILAKEQIRRDLLPPEVAKMYENKE